MLQPLTRTNLIFDPTATTTKNLTVTTHDYDRKADISMDHVGGKRAG